MIRFAITGGIGSGKSYVSALLEKRGIPIYNADNESKRLTQEDEGIRCRLIELLGESVYEGGKLNKPLLAAYLFASSYHAEKVNGIIHPCVKKDFLRWQDENAVCPIVGIESAILYEAGFEETVDVVLMVYAPISVRIERAMRRDGASEEQILSRMNAQMDDEIKRRKADFVLINDGVEDVEKQLDAFLNEIEHRI